MAKKSSNSIAAPADDWQARMDCDTLITAEQIAADPKRYKAALLEAKKRQDALADVFEDQDEEKPERSSNSKKSSG